MSTEALEPTPSARVRSAGRIVARNTLLMTFGQVVSIPLSILLSALTGRYLGASAIGYMYLGTTFAALGFLAVEWGGAGALPALVATRREDAGRLLGTSLVWRLGMTLLVFGVLDGVARFLGYDADARMAIRLLYACYALSTLTKAFSATILGFERADVSAYGQVLDQFSTLVISLPILLLGGGLRELLMGYVAVQVIVLGYVLRAYRSVGVGRLSVDREALKALLARGTPFLFLGIAMVLQPYVDAVFLSKGAPAEVVGWHAVGRRLVGVLVFPASVLIGALYPTLCRLFASDRGAFVQTTSGALRVTSLLVGPVALSCALYPELGVSIYSRESFGPAEDNLRVLSIYLFLMYFTMPLGVCITASGRQVAWAFVQAICVLVSVVLDPLLVPWFQARNGNGGLGVCWAAVASEVVVLGFGIALVPKGVFDRRVLKLVALSALAAAVMLGVARLMSSFNPWLAAPLANAAFLAALWLTGGIDKEYIDAGVGFFRRKFSR